MRSAPFRIRIDGEKCTGCISCELACSFHHKQVFSRKLASLEVRRSEEDWKISVIHYFKDENEHLACDYCQGETVPLCVKYCPREAIIKE